MTQKVALPPPSPHSLCFELDRPLLLPVDYCSSFLARFGPSLVLFLLSVAPSDLWAAQHSPLLPTYSTLSSTQPCEQGGPRSFFSAPRYRRLVPPPKNIFFPFSNLKVIESLAEHIQMSPFGPARLFLLGGSFYA